MTDDESLFFSDDSALLASLVSACDESVFSSTTITPESVAILGLVDCADQLKTAETQPLRLILAAKSAHLALQAALTAALAGTTGTGANDDELAAKHIAFLEDRGAGKVPYPNNDRVMSFPKLFAKAQKHLPWGDPIQVSEEENLLLSRLTSIRHDTEHPKQLRHSIQPAYIFEALPVAARLVVTLMETVHGHFSQNDLDELKRARDRIISFCAPVPTPAEN